jgi:hypothetical protein
MEIYSIILIVIVFILLIVITIGFFFRCPECKKWWCTKNEGSKITNENIKHETVTREDIHKDKNGNVTGRTERKEQIRVKYTDYLNYHSCKKCGHKWTTTSTSRSEF